MEKSEKYLPNISSYQELRHTQSLDTTEFIAREESESCSDRTHCSDPKVCTLNMPKKPF